MVPDLRKEFNKNFTESRYKEYLNALSDMHPGALDFRVAETPIFVPKDFTNKMLSACESIIDVIVSPDFEKLTERSIPSHLYVPGVSGHSHFIAFDFGVCMNDKEQLEPQLIEMQGFPSLFCYEAEQDIIARYYANVPDRYSSYLNGYDKKTYVDLLRDIIISDHDPENVILLEIYPEQQKTRIDFYCTLHLLGINTVCLTELKAEGKKLYYHKDGRKTEVKRIYNRLIFDDLQKQSLPKDVINLTSGFDVEWVPHPSWFYRISKFTLPFIDNDYVPQTFFLNEVKEALDLSEYVLKPLFSFAGMGVVIDVKQEDIDSITDPENWILQKKVTYAPIIQTPDEPAKAEIRLFYCWKEDWKRPVAVHNLAWLSKGKMIGTRYNKNKDWVGGTIAYFEK